MKISIVRTVYALVVLSCMVYAFVVLRGPDGIPGLLAKRRQVHDYEQVNQQLHREIEEKQARIDRLRGNDSPELEYEIRNRLKLARPGETVYILDGNKM